MPNDKLKRAISVALSFSMLTSAPQLGNAADLVPNNGMISSTPPPPCQTVIAPSDAAVGFSMKSFEAKISKALKPSKSVETEKVKRKTLATDVSGSCGNGVTYAFKAATGTLTISGNGAMADYEYNNHPWESYKQDIQAVIIENGVTSIGSFAFFYCSGLKSITIPDSVTSIGGYAFDGCTSLASVNIGNSVTSIGYSAFSDCSGLTSVTIPDSVTSIGSSAFYGCSSLTSITIPDSVTSIGSSAFYGCSSLTSVELNNDYAVSNFQNSFYYSPITSVTLGDRVTSIGSSAFSGCSGLISVAIGNGVESIGSSAFSGCSGLTSITIPDSVTSIGDNAFYGCSGLTSITIPDSLTSIGDYAFSGCSGLASITIPDGVTSIGYSAFSDCSGLTSITIPDSVTSIEGSAFSGCSGLMSITVSANNPNYSSFDGILYSKDFTSIVAVPEGITGEVTLHDSVTSIDNYTFLGCSGLTSITIPDGVSSIGYSAFSGCSGLTSITVSANNPNYSSYNGILYNKEGTSIVAVPKGITGEVTLHDSVTSIDNYTFSGCSGLTSIKVSANNPNYSSFNGILYRKDFTSIVAVPEGTTGEVTLHDSLTSIESSAFSGCSGLTSITVSANNPKYSSDSGILYNNGFTSIVAVPEGITGEVTLRDSLTSIGSSAFSGCSGLTSIVVSENNPNYSSDNGILYNKGFTFIVAVPKGITGEVTLHDSLTSVGDYAFDGCSGLTSMTIPDSVTSIGDAAFRDCSDLTSITIPDKVTSIGDYAFSRCSELSLLTYTGTTEPRRGDYVFYYCNKLTEVKVPQGYNGITFCGKPVNKMAIPDTPGEDDTSTTGVVDSSREDNNDPVSPSGDSNKGSSNAGVIAGSVVAALAVVAAVAVTAVMYVKKLACFARPAASVSEGGVPAEEV